ncbi:phosphate binding protein [Chondrocystis sp. NIES-4102]|nr:phosphate binding protein [Chondrocystis sp. NIES-4102]
MNVQDKSLATLAISTVLLAISPPLASQETESIKIDGSSTVYPLTQKIVEEHQIQKKQSLDIKVEFSGTSGGFDKFCRNASRPIQLEEMQACDNGKVRYIELPIAFDALRVVVNPQNNWLESITVDELAKIWSPDAEGKITRWNQIRPDFPDQPLNLYSQ